MKCLYLFVCILGLSFSAFAQEDTTQKSRIRPATFGFGLNFNDFSTASRIRSSSLETVLNNDQSAKLKDMSPGISLFYTKGLFSNLDVTTTLSFGFGSVMLENKPGIEQSGGFVAADASLQLKLLPENFIVNPYVSAGVGGMVSKGYYGAILPLGVGIRFRLSDETSIGVQSQYRVAVTESAGYHFVHGVTIMGRL